MKNSLLIIFIAFSVVKSFAQIAPNLGSTASTFTLFTSAGALTNTGASRVVGDVGTQAGSYSGFTPAVLTGSSHIVDNVSLAASSEMQAAYTSFNVNDCGTILTSPLGGPVSLAPGVYCTGGATTIAGDLILDGGNNLNSIFIFKIGGALSTATASRILLINGASLSNVYFQVNGAVSLGSYSVFRGTIVAGGTGDAAIELLEGAALLGRALTVEGAITLNNNQVNQTGVLPVTLTTFTAVSEGNTVSLSWTTTAETNSERFDIERSTTGKNWKTIGSVSAGGESSQLLSYNYVDRLPDNGMNLYRLKMTDKDLTYAYSRIRNVEITISKRTAMYPNPAVDRLTLDVDDMSQIARIQLNDITGRLVYDKSRIASTNLSEKLDVSKLPSGMYFARITRVQGTIAYVRILKL